MTPEALKVALVDLVLELQHAGAVVAPVEGFDLGEAFDESHRSSPLVNQPHVLLHDPRRAQADEELAGDHHRQDIVRPPQADQGEVRDQVEGRDEVHDPGEEHRLGGEADAPVAQEPPVEADEVGGVRGQAKHRPGIARGQVSHEAHVHGGSSFSVPRKRGVSRQCQSTVSVGTESGAEPHPALRATLSLREREGCLQRLRLSGRVAAGAEPHPLPPPLAGEGESDKARRRPHPALRGALSLAGEGTGAEGRRVSGRVPPGAGDRRELAWARHFTSAVTGWPANREMRQGHPRTR